MRRTIAFVISMMMIMSTIINPSIAIAETESAVEIQLSTSASASVKPNDVVTVTTAATKNTGIEGLQIEVHFNPDIFEFQSKENEDDYFVEGAANFGVKIFNSGKAAEGILIFSLTGTKVVSTTGDYCTFDLKVKNDANVKSGDYSIYVVTDDEEASNYTNVDTYTLTADAVTNTSVTISIPVTGITIKGEGSITGIGNTAKLTVVAQPANATQPNTDMSNVTWSTSDNKVATVENGRVIAAGEGTATITATFEGKTASKDIKVSKAIINGKVNVPDKAVCGQEIEASYSGNAVSEPGDIIRITWYRGETVIKTGNQYAPTADDVGKEIYVVVTSDKFNGKIESAKIKVEKAPQDAPAKPIIEAKENVITVKNVDHDAEYLLVGAGASQDFGEKTEFTVNYGMTYYVIARYPETATHKASEEAKSDSVTIVKAPYKLTVTAGEGGSVSGIPEVTVREGDEVTLTAKPGDFDHKFVKWEVTGITLTEEAAKANPITFTMGSEDVTVKAVFAEKPAVSIEITGTEFTYDGNAKTPGIAPTEVDGKKPTIEYFDSLNNKLKSAPTEAGTYKVKVTFTSSETSANCTTEAEKTFTIAKATKGKPAEPTVTDIKSDSFVVAFDKKQEYAINTTGEEPTDTKWAATIITTGLKPATTYYVFTRVKGNNNYNPSPAVYATVTTAHTYAWEVVGSGVVGENVRVGGMLPESLTGTIKNTGTGELTGITATIDSDTNFTLEAVPGTLARNGSLEIKVKPKDIKTDKERTYKAAVTVKAKDVSDITVNFTIKVTEKETAVISGITDTTVTFNGKTQGIDLSKAVVTGGGKALDDASKLTVTYDAAETRNAGEYIATIKYEDADYIGSTTAKLIINKKEVSVKGFEAQSKVYDGKADAEVNSTNAKLYGMIEGTVVGFDKSGLTFKFDDKNVGTSKAVKNTAPITLTGTDAGNYNLTNPTVKLTADITAKPVTITATVTEKTYNGRTDDANVTISFDGVIAGDEVTYQDAKGTYANADAGDAVKVEVTYIIGGKDASNYSLNVVKTATGKVNKADLNVTLTAPAAVTYDGKTHEVSSVTDDRVAADNGKTLYTLTYNNKDALPVDADTYEVTAKLTDEGSKNYNLKANTVDLVINKAGMSATNKEYTVAFMLAGAQTRPLSDLQLAPANVSGKWSVTTGTNEILDGEAKIDGENLVFTVKSGLTTADIGKKVELTLTFTPDKNYNPVTATVTVILAQDTYTNSIVGTLPTQVKLGDALDFTGVQLVTKFGSGAPEQTLDVNDSTKVEVTTTYDAAATGETALGFKTVTFTDKANGGITYTHTFTVVDVLEGVKLAADQIEYNYKLKEATTIGFDGKIHAVYKSGAKKALTHAGVVLTAVYYDGIVKNIDEARLLSTLGTTVVTLTYTENYFDGTSAAQSIEIDVDVSAAPAKPDGKPTAEGFIIEPIPDEGKDMKYYDGHGNEVLADDVKGSLTNAIKEPDDTLWNEVKNGGAFSSIDDDNIVYEQISFSSREHVDYRNGKMQITVPYPADSNKGDEFVMVIQDNVGHTETIVPIKTANGLQFITDLSNFKFAIGWYTPAPSPVLPTEPERDPEDNFWNEVYWTLLRSGQGSVITANAGYYDRVPQGVLRAVDISGNTLIINSAFGVQVVVTPGALEKLGMYRIFYPISYLKEMLKGSSVISGSGTTGITVGVLMPTTGDATVVEHPYTMTPATAGIIPGLESAANARPVIDNADGVSVLDGAQRNEGAVIGGGMLIGLGLLALLGAAYVTMRKRGN